MALEVMLSWILIARAILKGELKDTNDWKDDGEDSGGIWFKQGEEEEEEE